MRETDRRFPWLVAEMSANHDRCLEQAFKLVDVAAESGWTHLKLQTYDASSLTLKSNHPSQLIDEVWGYRTLHELYEAAAMPMEFHQPLFDYARDRGLVPFTSVYDPKDMDFLEALACPIYKIASFEMTYDDLIEEVAATKKPVILSTGMAAIEEVRHACEIFTKAGGGELTLLHCCSAYPAPIPSINLSAMTQLKATFGCKVGFSDHTEGSLAATIAVAMGASVIEKHFTNDSSRSGPDHRFSATPEVMREIRDNVHQLFQALGSGVKEVALEELENREKGRRSAFALRDISPGELITKDDFRFVRPAVGIKANERELIIGKRALKKIKKLNPILVGDLD